MSKNESEKKIKLSIIWNGKKTDPDREYSEDEDIDHVVREFLKANAPDEVQDISRYNLSLLDDPPQPLDRSKTLKELNINGDTYLLLTKRPLHIENSQDIWVAAGMAIYTAIIFSISVWILVSIWPIKDATLNVTRTVTIIGSDTSFSLGPETLLVAAMILFGVIGACVFSVFAISLHLGQYKDFDKSWTAWYLLRPVIGAGLALIISFLFRAGTLTVGSNPTSLNLLGLSGIAALAGVFAEQALRKLNELADTLFGKSTQPLNNSAPKGQ